MITVVTAPDVVLELRPPRFALLAYALSLVVAVVMVVTFLRNTADGAFTVLFLLVLAGILAFNTATMASRVRAHADGSLEVRNRFTVRRLQRSDVDRVVLGRQGGVGSVRRLELLLLDGQTLQLIATEAPPLPGLRRRLERQAAQLRAWTTDTPLPYR